MKLKLTYFTKQINAVQSIISARMTEIIHNSMQHTGSEKRSANSPKQGLD